MPALPARSAAWDRVHRRTHLVRRVLADVHRRGPDRLAAHAEAITEVFGDLDAFGRHVRTRWDTHWRARLDELVEAGTDADPTARRRAWRRLDADLPGSLAVIRHLDDRRLPADADTSLVR